MCSRITVPDPFEQKNRAQVIELLYHNYSMGEKRHKARFYWKKYAWITITASAKFLKRSLDIGASLSGLLLLAPLFGVTALAIKLTDNGPILFWQKRVGRYGQEFDFPKFRSMVVNAEQIRSEILDQSHHKDSLTFKMKDDPRITKVGKVIRKLSIDELPQLWCVFVGQMSLVGPRPPLPSEVSEYTLKDRRRLDVIPGLTCFWQVEGRGDIPFDEQVKLDVDYIESQSFWLDVKLLFKTVPAVLGGKGAY